MNLFLNGSRTLFITFVVTLFGCGPIQMYPGSPRKESQVSTIFFSSLGANIRSVTVDSVDVEHPGRPIAVLPGQHVITVGYVQKFQNSEFAISDEKTFDEEESGIGLLRSGHCTVTLSGAPGDSLFIEVKEGSYSLLGGSKEPRIEVKEEGFNRAPRFVGDCLAERRQLGIHSVN